VILLMVIYYNYNNMKRTRTHFDIYIIIIAVAVRYFNPKEYRKNKQIKEEFEDTKGGNHGFFVYLFDGV